LNQSKDKRAKTLVTVKKTADGAIRSIISEGHSGYADQGKDIICASVSTLVQALWIGLEVVLEAKDIRTIRDPEIPKIALEWDPKIPGAQLIARTIAISLKAVAETNPDYVNYLEIEEVFQED
jgi:uncharacterized protein YsxB (DUF464 family)